MNTISLPGIQFNLTPNLGTIEKPSTKIKTKRDLGGTYLVLFTATLLVNLYILFYYFAFDSLKNQCSPAFFATVTIFLAILVRNEVFLNILYRVLVKTCHALQVPVAIKNSVTSGLLHLGGIHSGCAVASLVWIGVSVFHPSSEGLVDKRWAILPLFSVLMAILIIMCIMALPAIRDRYHDLFELTHRFLGWSALLLLWGYALLTVWSSGTTEPGHLLTTTKSISLILTLLIAALILSPWLTVRKVQVQARVLSRTIIEITFRGRSEPGTFGRISRHAMADWHAFAIVSGERGADSHMMVISGVGDFTKGLISAPPSSLYVRKLKFPGLPYCVPMYRRSVIIATGAGMVPYLSLLPVLRRGNHRLIWIGRSFRENFGDTLCDIAFRWPDLVLVDSANGARPDIAALAVENYRSFGAEAVFVGSNPEGTKQIISACRALGIPAFGPSWDS